MGQESDLMAILQNKDLKKQLDQISLLLNEQLVALLKKVYQAGIRDGKRQAREEVRRSQANRSS